jgi:pteridine reductase
MDIQGKVAVVTGSAHRLGRVIALALAEAGAHIVVHYNSAGAKVDDTVAAIETHGVRAVAVQADLTQPDGPERIFAAAEAEFGGVDILINSAASMEPADPLTVSREAWQRVLDLNLTAPFFCAQLAAASMRKRGGGVIINMTDVAGLRPWAKHPAHSVSKAGLIMVTRVLAKALAPEIRVNAIAPGPVLKPDNWDDARWQTLGSHTLLKRTGSGYDVARAVLYLLQAEFMTGETLVLDGGRISAA